MLQATLDQYLMGFKAAEGVPDTFYVANARGVSSSTILPKVGVAFDGDHGVKLTVDGEDFVILNQDDVVIIVQEAEEAA